MKEVIFLGGSKRKVKDLPAAARIDAGHQLWQVQVGREPDDWKPMVTVGAGVKEIRIHQQNEYRVIYVAQFKDAIYVLHVFEKKTRQTSQHDIEVARSAYAEAKARHQKKS